MVRFIDSLLQRMGNWFGIVFKIIVPLLVMYLPVEALLRDVRYYCIMAGVAIEDLHDITKLMAIAKWPAMVVLAVLLFILPKVASVVEFSVCGLYCLDIALMFLFMRDLIGAKSILSLAALVVFVIVKILFYFFILKNRQHIDKQKRIRYTLD